jgi:hypothetical protein
VQRSFLKQHPSANLQVYAAWLPMLYGDKRSAWDAAILPDARVRHYWDEERIVGQWFARQVDGYEGTSWDIYYLYGPDATWDTVPGPLIGSGATIIGERQTLEAQIVPLLQN